MSKNFRFTDLSRELGCSYKHIWCIFHGKTRPSPEVSVELEGLTGIDRRCFLWPEEFPHPRIAPPNRYKYDRAKRTEHKGLSN